MTNNQPSAERITGGLFAALLLAFAASVVVSCCSLYKLGRMVGSRALFAGAWLRRRAWWGALPVLVLLAAPAVAQESEEPEHSPIAASAWCAIQDGDREEGKPGCDVGMGAALHCWGKACLVGVLGTETLGPGASWRMHVDEEGRVYAVALGVIAPWDGDGIRTGDWAVALGATLAFTGRGE